jgi:Winged helix DNA-binding domain
MENLGLAAPREGRPEDIVRHLLCMQSQDYGPARWSIGQRLVAAREAEVEAALASGRILRTHVLRPTWHFVLPEDIRWLLDINGPRVQVLNRRVYRQLELDEATLARSLELLGDALSNRRHRTRGELASVLAVGGIQAAGVRLVYLLMNAELRGVICSGPMQERQQMYALLDERAPAGRRLDPDEALAELTYRYFASHGPATERDLSWWASLTLAQCRRGLDLVDGQLERAEIDGVVYHFVEPPTRAPASRSVQLLQGYDEYIVGYRESKWVLDLSGRAGWSALNRPTFNAAVVRGGQVVGQWKRTLAPDCVTIQVLLTEAFGHPSKDALQAEAERHGAFLGLPARVEILDQRPS